MDSIISDNDKAFGSRIRLQRLNAGLTLQQLSYLSGLSSTHLGRIERGECFPSINVIRGIAKPLGGTDFLIQLVKFFD
ncbi:helix-turn-helix domain-containing protein [Chloroflexota bacterium]